MPAAAARADTVVEDQVRPTLARPDLSPRAAQRADQLRRPSPGAAGPPHVTDSAKLLDAVLESWEREHTRAVIERVEAVGDDPDAALTALVVEVLGDPGSDAAEWRILLAADHPVVWPVVQRVHEARIDDVARLLRARGLDADRAAARARIAYAAYLGNLLLTRGASEEGAVDRVALRTEFLGTLLAP